MQVIQIIVGALFQVVSVYCRATNTTILHLQDSILVPEATGVMSVARRHAQLGWGGFPTTPIGLEKTATTFLVLRQQPLTDLGMR
jgi:hypothetical protein